MLGELVRDLPPRLLVSETDPEARVVKLCIESRRVHPVLGVDVHGKLHDPDFPQTGKRRGIGHALVQRGLTEKDPSVLDELRHTCHFFQARAILRRLQSSRGGRRREQVRAAPRAEQPAPLSTGCGCAFDPTWQHPPWHRSE